MCCRGLLRTHPQDQPGPTPLSPCQAFGCTSAQTSHSGPRWDPAAGDSLPPGGGLHSGVPMEAAGTALQSLSQSWGALPGAWPVLVTGANPQGAEEGNSPCLLGRGLRGRSGGNFQSLMMQAVWGQPGFVK